MTAEEYDDLEDLCNRITSEKDPVTFDELVLALNELLEKTQRVSTSRDLRGAAERSRLQLGDGSGRGLGVDAD